MSKQKTTMNKVSIRYKLLLSFIAMALLTVPVNLYTLSSTNRIKQNFDAIIESTLPRLQALYEMRNTSIKIDLFISSFENKLKTMPINESSPTKIDATKDKLLAYLQEIELWQNEYQNHFTRDQQNSLHPQTLNTLRDAVVIASLNIFSDVSLHTNGKFTNEKKQRLEDAQNRLDIYIKNALSIESLAIEKEKINTLNKSDRIFNFSLLMNAAIIFISIMLSLILTKKISEPIIHLKNFTNSINQDTLEKRSPLVTNDEVGELVISINGMLEELYQAKTKLIETSRLAGIAEVTTSILHNVGNVLNSINVSAALIAETISHSKIIELSKLFDILDKNKDNLQDYITNNEKGKIFIPYFKALSEHLEDERLSIKEELNRLNNNLQHVNNVISMQQSSIRAGGVYEKIIISDLIEEVLNMHSNTFNRENIEVKRHYPKIPMVLSIKSKLHQIIVNLIKNACESLVESKHLKKILVIKLSVLENKFIQITIQDNGLGINKDHLINIFSFGFTTKEHGHGYGLHNCALLATELGGELKVNSAGPGQGASFILEIPSKKIK